MKTQMQITTVNGKFQTVVNGQKITSASKYYLKQKVERMSSVSTSYAAEPEQNPALKFPINQRFGFVERLVKMVGDGSTASAIVTGDGGLGKSHTVVNALKASGLKDISDIEPGTTVAPRSTFRIVKGYSTAKGLFRILFENRNSIIVFDDCDSILKDDDAVNLLKAALDSYDKRFITWNTNSRDDELPRMFQFTGGIVFISNRDINKIDQALRTRSMCVDLSMTIDQKLERMEVIMKAPSFLPGISLKLKQDALDLIRAHKDEAREVSLRTLISVSKIRNTGDKDWADLATYSITA